ncbi:hypothetical protein AURDEDRAFT_171980 [Auricularia subglabra TFB-10046 SS5]|nr:hypothetical protein AURDEDRAFT_171980 [Auricularia subglabra TFB-10046 SS5]
MLKRKHADDREQGHDRPAKVARPDRVLTDVANAVRQRLPPQPPQKHDQQAALPIVDPARKDAPRREYWLKLLQRRTAEIWRRLPWRHGKTRRIQPEQVQAPHIHFLIALHHSNYLYTARPPTPAPPRTPSGAPWRPLPAPPVMHRRGKVSVRSPEQLLTRRRVAASPLGPRPLPPPHELRVRALSAHAKKKLPRMRDAVPDYHWNAVHTAWIEGQPAFRKLTHGQLKEVFSRAGGVRELAVWHHKETLRLAAERLLQMRMARDLAYCGYVPPASGGAPAGIWARRR